MMTDRRYPLRWRRGVLGAAVMVLGAAMLAAPSIPATAEDNDPDPPAGDGGTGRDNACTPAQIEGGYEDLGGRCQLTGWNWEFGLCHYDVDVGALGDVSSSCEPSGCVTATCDGGGPTGPSGGGNDDSGDWTPDFDDFGEFGDWCTDQGGDLSTGDPESTYHVHTCSRDGAVFALCSWYESEPDLEPLLDCFVLPPGDPDPNEFPGPTTTLPGPLERPPGAVDDVAAPSADPVDEPNEPVGPVVTVDVSTGVVLSDVAAPAGSGDEPGEPMVPAPTTPGGFDIFDVIVVPVEEASDEG